MSEPNLCANINACEEFRWVYLAPPQGRCRARPAGGAQTEGTGTGKATAAASGGLPRRPSQEASRDSSPLRLRLRCGVLSRPRRAEALEGMRGVSRPSRGQEALPDTPPPPPGLCLCWGLGLSTPRKQRPPPWAGTGCPPSVPSVSVPPLKRHQLLQREGGVPMYRWECGGPERKCHSSTVTQTVHAGSGT